MVSEIEIKEVEIKKPKTERIETKKMGFLQKLANFNPKKLIYGFKSKLAKNKYPVKVITLQKLMGNTFMIQEDRERRLTDKKENTECMESFRKGVKTPAVSYDAYVPNAYGEKFLLALDTDDGERYPLKPLTYGDIFVFDKEGRIQKDWKDKPLVRNDFAGKVKKSDEIVGLKSVSKGRISWLIDGYKRDLLKHQLEEDHGSKVVYAIMLIMTAVALIIFFSSAGSFAGDGAEIASNVGAMVSP